jgi:exodeoxyribonuclease-3
MPTKASVAVAPALKILSWNVNGIRSASRHGFLDVVMREHPDVLLLQEVRAENAQWPAEVVARLSHELGYDMRASMAVKNGYSGTAVLYRRSRVDAWGGVAPSAELLDDEVALGEGRFCGVRLGDRFILASVYFPNSQREGTRLPVKLAFCRALLEHCREWSARGLHVVLGGDFNIAHTEEDLANPKQNVRNAGFLPEERAWMTEFLEAGHVDTFRLFTRGNGHYTWWSNRPTVRERNIGWRLDYLMVDDALRSKVVEARILPEVRGSDHCPVSLVLTP